MTALHGTLARRLSESGDAIAVLGSGRRAPDLVYDDFAKSVAGLQSVLQTRAVKTIGILSTRRAEAYISVIAAHLMGVKFVPMNPDMPVERLEKIAQLGDVDLVLTDPTTTELAEKIGSEQLSLADCPLADVGQPLQVTPPKDPATIAYQMFTSGSTGDPKGVPVSYGNLDHYVHSVVDTLSIPESARFSQLFDLSFDLSLHDIFVALSRGGTLCPASKIDLMMPHVYLAKKQIDVWFSVPMIAGIAIQGQEDAAPTHRLQMALFCGEPLPTDYATGFSAFLEPGAPLYNLYGPTEATIAFTAARFTADCPHSSVPLGAAFGENLIAIDSESQVRPADEPGTEGELLLAGPQVFAGYTPPVSDPFVQNDGTTYYRSGDLVRVADDGALIHIGRTDSQIKLRGYRIELGDIEAAVRRAFGVTSAAAVVLGEGAGREIGLAYQADQDISDLVPLDEHLPSYMRPARWLRLGKMPVNVNGKIDRKAIRQMDWPG